jgi:acetyl esterase/lipase
VIGSIRSCEPITRHLAAQTGCTVASVEYRLGPEDRHPASVDDACLAWQAMVDRVPHGGRIGVAGDSFGGFLAAQVDHHMLLAGERQPDVQVLIYPLVDFTLESPSIERFANGYLLTKGMMHWFRENYLSASDDPRAISPWFWKDLKGSAPAIVVTAGFDPLVDEGDAWAERLQSAGTLVRHRRHPSLIHGFLSFAGAVRAAREATDLIAADFVDLMRGDPSR